ncbi:MAG: hypothetical protein WCW44_05035 [archaeon]|jgi:hypothetical protein
MKLNKIRPIVLLAGLVFSLFLLFGCTSGASFCEKGVCGSSDGKDNNSFVIPSTSLIGGSIESMAGFFTLPFGTNVPLGAFTESAKNEYYAYLEKNYALNYKVTSDYFSQTDTNYVPPQLYLPNSTSTSDGNRVEYKYLSKTRTDFVQVSPSSTSSSISIFDSDTNKSFSCTSMTSPYYSMPWSCTCSTSQGGTALEIQVSKLSSQTILGQTTECYLWRFVTPPNGSDANYTECFNSHGLSLKDESVSLSTYSYPTYVSLTKYYALYDAINAVESSSLSDIIPNIGSEGEKIFSCFSLATECTPGQSTTTRTGSNVGICRERIVTRVCNNGFWSDTVTQEGVLPATESCDASQLDEDCDGVSNEGCSCVSGATQSCSPTNLCKTGTQSCANGQWSACTEVGNKTTNSSCGTGKVCSNTGVCTSISCSLDSQCPNNTGKVCKIAKCLSPGDWNSVCSIQNLSFGTSCGSSKICDSTGECVEHNCTIDSDCATPNNCQVGTCQNSVCNFTNKAENFDCNSGSKCNASGQCVLVTCSLDSNCASVNPCLINSCNNKGLWNSVCATTGNKPANTSCSDANVCNASGVCLLPACSLARPCVSTNPCQVASCLNDGNYNASCSYANRSDNYSCGGSNICISGYCQRYSGLFYNPSAFNGTGSVALIKVNNNSNIDSNFAGLKSVLISSSDKNALSFDHNFSVGDLNLMKTVITKGLIDENWNYLLVNDLNIQGTKTMYLQKSLSSNAVCVLDEDVNDINSARNRCTTIYCPGEEEGISCEVDGNMFKISGLTHSFVTETQLYCGDGICNADEDCSSCVTDCNVCISCSNDLECGVDTFIGSNFCSSNNVMRKLKDSNCINAGTANSQCLSVESNVLITACTSSQTCVSGACVQTQGQTPSGCTLDSNCLSTEKCISNACSPLACSTGFVAQNHKCVCNGTKCNNVCYSSVGICCDGEWKANKTACVTQESGPSTIDLNNSDKLSPVLEITLLGIPILYVGVGAIVFVVLMIVIFNFLPSKN